MLIQIPKTLQEVAAGKFDARPVRRWKFKDDNEDEQEIAQEEIRLAIEAEVCEQLKKEGIEYMPLNKIAASIQF